MIVQRPWTWMTVTLKLIHGEQQLEKNLERLKNVLRVCDRKIWFFVPYDGFTLCVALILIFLM